jgi:ATP-dependent Clp protease ATP-binding subunit ClpB
MNVEKYTQNAQQIVIDCQSIVRSAGNQMVDGEHIHLALLEQKDGLIPKLLKKMDVDVLAYTAEVKSAVNRISKVTGDAADKMYGTRRYGRIFDDAESIAEQFKDDM